MGRTLIVVDMQNDFVYGPLGTPEARAIVLNVQKKIEEYRGRGDSIYFTLDNHYSEYLFTHEGRYLPIEHCIAGTYGWKVISDISISTLKDRVTYKGGFGATWWHYDLNSSLLPSANIELVGVCTDICVVSNALILRSLYPYADITVDASCCAGTTPEKHKAALEVMKSCHIDILND